MLHDISTNQQIGNSLEILEIFIVRLLCCVQNLLHEDHYSVEEIFVLDPAEHLINGKLNYTTLQTLMSIGASLVFRSQQLCHQGTD